MNKKIYILLNYYFNNGFIATVKLLFAKLINKNQVVYEKFQVPETDYPIKTNLISSDRLEIIDIIVCVHNALEDVTNCLESIYRNTTLFRLILVDDGSDLPTSQFLKKFSDSNDNIIYTKNEVALGYTRAANIGIQFSESNYIVLLNSDTIVSKHWLEDIYAVFKRYDRVGMVGPLSNTASWQSVPKIFNEFGDWASNDLENRDLADYAEKIWEFSDRLNPIVGFLNGFCLAISRNVIETIGLLDEKNFPKGYGEENDYCLRTTSAGFHLRVCDSVFVYHAQSKSYSHEKRKILVEKSDKILKSLHGLEKIQKNLLITSENPILFHTRNKIKNLEERIDIRKTILSKYKDKRILFLLPVKHVGGGANVVLNECEIMNQIGIQTDILNYKIHFNEFNESFQDLNLKSKVIYADDTEEIKSYLDSYDAVIATQWMTVDLLKYIQNSSTIKGYYIQDFEPDFYNPGSAYFNNALKTYSEDASIRRFTKTRWNYEKIKNFNSNIAVVGIDYDSNLYVPRRNFWETNPKIVITGMVRYETPRRNPELTKEILERIAEKYKNKVQIEIFGSSNYKGKIKNIKYHKYLNRFQMAYLLNKTDIFVDFSKYQAMGLTALEAMACGCAVILPKNGGCTDFSENGKSSILVDTENEKECYSELEKLIQDNSKRIELKKSALETTSNIIQEKVVLNILKALFNEY